MVRQGLISIIIVFVLLAINSPDFAQDWAPVAGMTDYFLEMNARSGSDTIVVSTNQSGCYWTGDLGATWQTLPTPGQPRSFEIFRRNSTMEMIISRSERPYLRRSTDIGMSWAPAAEQIPDCGALQLFLDPSGRLWAYKRYQLYFSDDLG
ncbi:hypothetical protein KKG05_00585, partial [bacterium]|nr:hypothetical protein [bacterium]